MFFSGFLTEITQGEGLPVMAKMMIVDKVI